MFQPKQDYILVLPIQRKISDVLWTAPEKYSRGMVVAVGPGKWLKRKSGKESGYFQPLTVKPGDFITYGDLDWIFPKYEENGVTYRILQEADVTFISERQYIDEHNSLTDAEIDALVAAHNVEYGAKWSQEHLCELNDQQKPALVVNQILLDGRHAA